MRSVLVKLAAGSALALFAGNGMAQEAPQPGARPPAIDNQPGGADIEAQPRSRAPAGAVDDVPPPQTFDETQQQPRGQQPMQRQPMQRGQDMRGQDMRGQPMDDQQMRGQFQGRTFRDMQGFHEPMRRGPVVDLSGNPIPENLRWRYRWENGRWMYWLPSNRWVVWSGDRWVNWDQQSMDQGQFADQGQGWCPPGYVYTGGDYYGQPTYDQYGAQMDYGYDPYGTAYRGGYSDFYDDSGYIQGGGFYGNGGYYGGRQGYYDQRGTQWRSRAGYRGYIDQDSQYRQGFRGQEFDQSRQFDQSGRLDSGADFRTNGGAQLSPRDRGMNGTRSIAPRAGAEAGVGTRTNGAIGGPSQAGGGTGGGIGGAGRGDGGTGGGTSVGGGTSGVGGAGAGTGGGAGGAGGGAGGSGG